MNVTSLGGSDFLLLSLGKAGASNFASLLPLLVLISKAAGAWMALIQNNLGYRFSFFEFLVFILTTIRLILIIFTVKGFAANASVNFCP